jgi:hypothetical protein
MESPNTAYHMYHDTIACEIETAKRDVRTRSETYRMTKAETIADLQKEADPQMTNFLLEVANKMRSDEFFCQDQSKTVVNICHEPLAKQKGSSFYNEMRSKCLEYDVHHMCKYSTSKVCGNEETKFLYGELSGAPFTVPMIGDTCIPKPHSEL